MFIQLLFKAVHSNIIFSGAHIMHSCIFVYSQTKRFNDINKAINKLCSISFPNIIIIIQFATLRLQILLLLAASALFVVQYYINYTILYIHIYMYFTIIFCASVHLMSSYLSSCKFVPKTIVTSRDFHLWDTWHSFICCPFSL